MASSKSRSSGSSRAASKSKTSPSAVKPAPSATSARPSATKTVAPAPTRRATTSAPVAVGPTAEELAAANEKAESRFWMIATALLVVGIALRQLNLQAFPYHPDEAIHAWYAADFKGYTYDPVYHGPLLYHLNALVMAIAGANDYTGRLAPSLLGIGVLALVLGPARKFLGRDGTLWSLGLLALSPVVVTYSRRVLHDSLVMLLTLGLVLCFQTAREKGSGTKAGGWARVGVLVLSALFLATKANVFFILVMLAAFWVAENLDRLTSIEGLPSVRALFGSVPESAWKFVPMFALLVVATTSHWTIRDPNIAAQMAFVIPERAFTIICVLACGLVFAWLMLGPRVALDDSGDPMFPRGVPHSEKARRHSVLPYVVGATLAALLFTFLYGQGYRLLGAERLTVGEWITTYWSGVTSAMPRLIQYWAGQQAKPRLAGPHDYYIIMLALYELPILLLFLAGLWRASTQRTPFTDLLVWWAVTSFALYSLANEKMPWLMTHLVLPFALLGGWWAARVFAGASESVTPITNAKARTKAVARKPLPDWVLPTVAGLSAVYLLRGAVATNFARGADKHEPMFYAQTTETFRDALFAALDETDPTQGNVWVDNGAQLNGQPNLASAQWPCAWYLRNNAAILEGSTVAWGHLPDAKTRICVTSPERWATMEANYPNWRAQRTEFYIWSRPTWPALRPDNWIKFWTARVVNPNGGLDGLLEKGEWSSNFITVAIPSGKATQSKVVVQ